MSKLQNKVLVCPLDWGLGHASRMIPVIYTLLKNNFEVIIGVDNFPLKLLKKEFPDLLFIKFSSHIVKYSRTKSLVFSLFRQLPTLLFQIYKEHRVLKKIIRENDIDIVISDNRYGLWNKEIHSIFVTHQLRIMMPKGLSFFELPICLLNRFFIKKYNQCWVPDFSGEINLSGNLSHNIPFPANASFIGPITRFAIQAKTIIHTSKTNILVILSGPEPQRSIFEKNIIEQLLQTSYTALIVSGLPGLEKNISINEKIKKIDHLSTEEMRQEITDSDFVVCRSGYSSVMDLVYLKKTAIFVPTPGQTEQEYLGDYLIKNKWFYSISQDQFNLQKAIVELQKCSPVFPEISLDLLEKNIEILRNI